MARINNKHGGVRPNSGRKSKAEEMGLKSLLEDSFTAEDRKAVIENLTAIAKGDDLKAAVSASSLLLAYTFGKPHETIQATITHREFEVEIGGNAAVESEPEFVN